MSDGPVTEDGKAPDDLGGMPGFVVVNPESIGDPEQTPRVFVGDALCGLLNPCQAHSAIKGGHCNGVNGFHADDCDRRAKRGSS